MAARTIELALGPPAPGAETQRIAEQVRDAIAAQRAVRIVGSGSWLDAGGRSTATCQLTTRETAGVREYEPGDLTITIGAGTTLAEIRQVTGAANQWLPLDPHGSDDGTIGATVATGSWGPLATGFGSPRDMVIGLEAVTGAGAVVRGGGRVVKNVAGFDLVRLFTGSWGTIGVLTEVSLRLRARPERDETLAVAIDDTPDDAAALRTTMWGWPFTPLAAELLSAPLASRVCGVSRGVALFRVAGNREAVDAQRKAIGALGAEVAVTPAAWTALRQSEPEGATVLRLSALPTQLGAVCRVAKVIAGEWHATLARGTVRCFVPRDAEPRPQVHYGGTIVVERAGALVREGAKPRPTLELERRLRATFDPAAILNPGVFPLE